MKIIQIVHEEDVKDKDSNNFRGSNQFDIKNFLIENYERIVQSADEEWRKNNIKPKSLISLYKDVIVESFIATTKGSSNFEVILQNRINDLISREKIVIEKTAIEVLEAIRKSAVNNEYITLPEARKKYPLSKNLSVGSYTLHPRNPHIITRLESFHRNLAIEKNDELIILLGKMGAKSVEIIHSSDALHAGEIEANLLTINAKSSANMSIKKTNQQHLIVEFEGKHAEIPENLLSSSIWFSDDSRLLSIFESQIIKNNRIIEYTIINKYSDSFDFDFDLAANFLKFSGDIKAEYELIRNQSCIFKLKFSS